MFFRQDKLRPELMGYRVSSKSVRNMSVNQSTNRLKDSFSQFLRNSKWDFSIKDVIIPRCLFFIEVAYMHCIWILPKSKYSYLAPLDFLATSIFKNIVPDRNDEVERLGNNIYM